MFDDADMERNYLEITKEFKKTIRDNQDCCFRISNSGKKGLNWSIEFFTSRSEYAPRVIYSYNDNRNRLRKPISGFFYSSLYKSTNMMMFTLLPIGTRVKFNYELNGISKEGYKEGQLSEDLYKTDLVCSLEDKNGKEIMRRFFVECEYSHKDYPTIKF